LRVLSGIQPSGNLHLGNYFAMMKRMIDYQEHHTLFCFVVNLHALTSVFDAQKLRDNTFDACCDFLALGIDPEKSYFYVQSDVPEVTELTWLLSNVTPMGLLERGHSYKDKLAKGIPANHGLFAYPVLMAADILLYGADIVPVGKDQKQHLEMTRDIAIRFNQTYGEVFVVPEPDIPDSVAMVPGLDGQKMSKSYGNTIDIFSPQNVMKKRVMSIVTDATPVEAPKNPDTCNLYQIYRLFSSPERLAEVRGLYLHGGLAYGALKAELAELLLAYFADARGKYSALIADRAYLDQVLAQGAQKARAIAAPVLKRMRKAVGIDA